MTLMNPHQLLLNCRSGDPVALEAFFQFYQRPVYRLAISFLQDLAEAEDVTQETFVIAFSNLEAYRGQASLTSWLYGIALNLCRRRMRKRQGGLRLLNRLGHSLQAPPSIEQMAFTRERDQRLWQAIQDLNEKHRIPLILFYYHDLTVAEIAQILDLPKGTVISRLNTARQKLRQVMSEGQEESEGE